MALRVALACGTSNVTVDVSRAASGSVPHRARLQASPGSRRCPVPGPCRKGTRIEWGELRQPANELASTALRRAGFSGLRTSDSKRQVWGWLTSRASALRHGYRLYPGWAVTFAPLGRVELLPADVPGPGPDEVLVRTTFSAVSPGTERARYLGLPNAQVAPGYVPGFSAAGIVEAVGEGVAAVAPGDRVAVLNGTHRSVVRVPAAQVALIPHGVADADAAFSHLGVIALQGVAMAEVQGVDTVAVLGLGVIGALAQRLSCLEGARSTVAIARSSAKSRPGRPAPDHVLTTAADAGDIERLRVPVVLDATGDPAAIDQAVTLADTGGRIVLLGSSRGAPVPFPLDEVRERGLEVVGAHVETTAMQKRLTGVDVRRHHAERFLAHLASGALSVSDLVDVIADPREPEVLYRRLATDKDLVGALFDWRGIGSPSDRAWTRLPQMHAPGIDYGRLPLRAPRVRARAASQHGGAPSLGVGLVGCGDIALLNAAAVASASNTHLVCCFDPVRELAVEVAAQHASQVATSYEALLDEPEVQAVFLCVPHDLHWPLAKQAIAAGKHVIVEKPPAHRLADASAMVEAAEAAGVYLTFCLPNRYEPEARAASWLLRRSALGELRGGAVTFLADRPPGYFAGGLSGRTTSNWRSAPSRAGGGITIMNLTHNLDLLLHLAGEEVTSVSANTAEFDSPPGIEDAATLALVFANGAVINVQGATHVRGTAHEEFRLWGRHGHLELQPLPQIYTMRALTGYRPGRWQRLALPDHIDTRQAFVSSFATAVAMDIPPDVRPSDGLRLQAVIEAAYRSAASGQAETVVSFSPRDGS